MHKNRRKGEIWTILIIWTKALEIASVGAMAVYLWTSTSIWIGY